MMTRDEAEAAARKGAKVRHEDWQPDEWIELRKGGAQFDEQGGHLLHAFDFYGPDDSWSIVEPAPAQAPVEPDLAARVAELETDLTKLEVTVIQLVRMHPKSWFKPGANPDPASHHKPAPSQLNEPVETNTTFRTSRKPDAPGVMGDEEIAMQEAVTREMDRIRRLFSPTDGDHEDLITYAKSVVLSRLAHQSERGAMKAALEPFAFLDSPTTQEAWEIRYQDRFSDWIDFEDIESARAALAAIREGL